MTDGLVWIDPDNTQTDLNDGTITTTYGLSGEHATNFEIYADPYPLYTGSKVRHVRTSVRDVDIPITISCASRSALMAKIRAMAYALDPSRGDGKLRRTAADGVIRDLTCRYRDGLDNLRHASSNISYGVLAFRAYDPFWAASSASSATVTTGDNTTTWFGHNWFPFSLSSSTVFGDVTIDNTGDVETYPIIYINGAGTNPTLKNLTTSKTLTLTVTLVYGDQIEIDTRPGYRTVKLNGTSRFDIVSGSLWSLQTGNNTVRVEMSDSTSDSSVQLSYYMRYHSA